MLIQSVQHSDRVVAAVEPVGLRMDPRVRTGRVWRWLGSGVLVVMCLWPIWFSLGDHALQGRSVSRYAEASREMALDGDWLIPHHMGQVHLTKPPLVYWLEAGAARWLGASELAMRLPSAIAGSATLIALVVFARLWYGPVTGWVAGALLALQPLHIVISRLTLTDGLLGLFWWLTLACGYEAVTARTHRGRWAVGMWVAVGMGLLAKGPVAWLAPGIVAAWAVWSYGREGLRRLRPAWGLPLSSLPLMLWVAAVVFARPEAWSVWWHEMADRATGSGDHNEPFWYYLPVFFVGLFPASILLALPGLSIRWRRIRAAMRVRGPLGLMILATTAPLLVFSLISGKLATYLLPCAAPIAVVGSLTLVGWMTGRLDRRRKRVRPPDAIKTFTVITTIGAAACIVAGWRMRGVEGLATTAPFMLVPLVGGVAWRLWRRRELRGPSLVLVWLVMIAAITWGEELEDAVLRLGGPVAAMPQMRSLAGDQPYRIVLWSMHDEGDWSFYTHELVGTIKSPQEAQALLDDGSGRTLFVMIKPESWQKLVGDPELGPRTELVFKTRAALSDDELWLARINAR